MAKRLNRSSLSVASPITSVGVIAARTRVLGWSAMSEYTAIVFLRSAIAAMPAETGKKRRAS